MKFASVRLIAADIKAMVAFYELVTGQTAVWLATVRRDRHAGRDARHR